MTHRTARHSALIVGVLCLLIGAIGVGLPTRALAQTEGAGDTASDPEDIEKANAHFAKGAQLFSEKRYAPAIVEFLSAYKYKPDPMLLYNISVAHARLGNIDEAYKAAARAAASDKMPEKAAPTNSARVRAWGAVLRAGSLGERIAAAQKAQTATRATLSDDLSTAAPPPPGAADNASSALSAIGWSGVAASAVGVGLMGYATYVDLSMGEDIDAYKSAAQAGDSRAYRDHKDDLAGRQSTGLIALYSGVGLTAVGLGLLSYDLLSEDGETTSIGVSAGDGGGSIRISYFFQ